MSINTDFAETEVDQRQVNLTRFPLFFPEKRAFFLEGASVFAFSRETGNSIVPFFSRRIGLDDSGVPQPIDYGAKLTGHAGAFDIGVLQVRTRDRGSVPGEDFTVMRSQHRFWRQSYVGALFTNRSDASRPARQTAGVDFALATAQFLGKPGARGQRLLPEHDEAPGFARRRGVRRQDQHAERPDLLASRRSRGAGRLRSRRRFR